MKNAKQRALLSMMCSFWMAIIFLSAPDAVYSQPVDSLRSQLKNYADLDSERSDSLSAEIMNNISGYYRRINVDSALHYGQKALKKLEGHGWDKLEADIRYNIAAIYYISGEYDRTLQFARDAFDLYEIAGSRENIPKILNIEGLVFAGYNEHEKAIELYREADNILDAGQDPALRNKVMYNTAISLKSQDSTEQALKTFKNSLSISEQIVDSLSIARNRTFMAEILMGKGELVSAKDHLKKAITYLTESDKWDLAFTYATMAKFYGQAGDLQLGVKYGEQSYKLARELQAKWELQRVTKILADIYADLEDFEKALKYQREHSKWNKEVYNEQREQNLARLELAREEAANAQLKAKNEQQQKNIQESQFINLSLGSTLFFIMVVAIVIYRSNRKQKALNEQLRDKKELIEKAKDNIEHKNDKLEELNKTKNKILSVISHDARGPMSSLHSLIDFVEHHDMSKEDMETILSSVSNNLQQTTQMFNNIMHWARSQFDNYEPDIAEVDLVEIAVDLMDEFKWQFNKKDVEIINDIDEGTNVMADRDMLTIVLRNLVSNALKFCEEYDSVTITAETQQDEVAISVIDTGIGIDEEEQEKIFSNEHYSNRGTENESGSGFGLKICQEFVAINNGKITIEGEPGEGTKVTVTLPAVKKTAHAPMEEREKVSKLNIGVTNPKKSATS